MARFSSTAVRYVEPNSPPLAFARRPWSPAPSSSPALKAPWPTASKRPGVRPSAARIESKRLPAIAFHPGPEFRVVLHEELYFLGQHGPLGPGEEPRRPL